MKRLVHQDEKGMLLNKITHWLASLRAAGVEPDRILPSTLLKMINETTSTVRHQREEVFALKFILLSLLLLPLPFLLCADVIDGHESLQRMIIDAEHRVRDPSTQKRRRVEGECNEKGWTIRHI